MISETKVLKAFQGFANSAMPLLYIKDDESYEDAMHLLEGLIEKVGEDDSQPEQYLVALLSQAISSYENKQTTTKEFLQIADDTPKDIALLRTLIDQYQLKFHEIPEIGDKTLVSKILSGKRQLTKAHIKSLSERFHINPSLFFKIPDTLPHAIINER